MNTVLFPDPEMKPLVEYAIVECGGGLIVRVPTEARRNVRIENDLRCMGIPERRGGNKVLRRFKES